MAMPRSFRHFLSRKLDQSDRLTLLLWWVFVGSFLETTFVPVPYELMLIPVMLANLQRIWLISLSACTGAVVGALVGYGIGALSFQAGGQAMIDAMGAQEAFESFRQRLEADGFIALFIVALTPVPVQVATVGAGFTGYSILLFSLAVGLSRAARYAGLSLLVIWLGPRAKRWIRHHRKTAIAVGVLLLVGLIIYLAMRWGG